MNVIAKCLFIVNDASNTPYSVDELAAVLDAIAPRRALVACGVLLATGHDAVAAGCAVLREVLDGHPAALGAVIEKFFATDIGAAIFDEVRGVVSVAQLRVEWSRQAANHAVAARDTLVTFNRAISEAVQPASEFQKNRAAQRLADLQKSKRAQVEEASRYTANVNSRRDNAARFPQY